MFSHLRRVLGAGALRSVLSGLTEPAGQVGQCVWKDEVVGERALVPGLDDARVGERLEVMRQRRLSDTEQRQQLAGAQLAGMPRKHLDEPDADRIA